GIAMGGSATSASVARNSYKPNGRFLRQSILRLPADIDHAAAPIGFARSIRSRSRGLFIASHRSLRRWTLSQKSGLLPNTRARMSAVAAVTVRRSLHSSLTCLRCTSAITVIIEIDARCFTAAGHPSRIDDLEVGNSSEARPSLRD